MTAVNCQTARALLMVYLDSELDAATTQRVNQHLVRCPSCRQRFEAEQVLEHGLARVAAEPEPMPGAVGRRLEAALAREAGETPGSAPAPAPRDRRPSPPRRRPFPLAQVASLVAAAVLVVAAVLAWDGRGADDDAPRSDAGSPRVADAPAPSVPPPVVEVTPLEPLAPSLAEQMLALHRVGHTAGDDARDRARQLLAVHGAGDLTLPGDGLVGGHPLRLVAAQEVVLDGRPSVKLVFHCCERPATVFVMPVEGPIDGDAVPLPVTDEQRPARYEGLHSWSRRRGDAWVGVLSEHAVDTLLPSLSI